jgi:hypothetical protein
MNQAGKRLSTLDDPADLPFFRCVP